MKNILIILMIFLTACTSKYKTSTLFEDSYYRYEVSYPYNWTFTSGSTKETEYELENGDTLKSIAIIGKYINNIDVSKENKIGDNIFTGNVIGGIIEIFILDKDSYAYNELIQNYNSFKFLINNFLKNNKKSLQLKDFYKWLDDDKENNNALRVIFNIEQNKAILFFFKGISYSINYTYYGNTGYDNKDKKEITKEVYKIINSLSREKIK